MYIREIFRENQREFKGHFDLESFGEDHGGSQELEGGRIAWEIKGNSRGILKENALESIMKGARNLKGEG